MSVYGYDTTAWNLGEKTSFIELDTKEISAEKLSNLEIIVNEKIKDAVPVYSTWIENIHDPFVKDIRFRGLPDDHKGPIRIITIKNIDVNLCCGTHLTNLSHLQAIKLLAVEKGKKEKVNLVFIAGQRILNYVGLSFEKEKMFTSILKGHPDDHLSLMQKIQNSLKVSQKNSLNLLREVAKLEAEKLNSLKEKPSYFSQHRKEGDNEYMSIIANEVGNTIFLFLTTGEEKDSGLFLLSGQPDDVSQLSAKIVEILDGKGAGKSGRYQGKARSLVRRNEAEIYIKNYFATK